jgi:hypothetical protein
MCAVKPQTRFDWMFCGRLLLIISALRADTADGRSHIPYCCRRCRTRFLHLRSAQPAATDLDAECYRAHNVRLCTKLKKQLLFPTANNSMSS